jgi:phenylalanyl-tRNA synthetase alpha chain
MEEQKGGLHPLTIVKNDAMKILTDMGFEITLERELEDGWHNFDALNIPKDHPARDMQDTFFVDGVEDRVLRTHTSSVQVRYMEENKPPFAIVVPGKVFRQEATDSTHEAQFHQIEGLMVGENITLANLKGVLETFLKKLLGDDIEIRLRPGYFPFVEPGVEVDLKFRDKWLEVLGAGMVHPNVLKNLNIDGEKFQGFAFGVGIDRLAMMKYNIPDVRMFYTGDLRVVEQFKKAYEG